MCRAVHDISPPKLAKLAQEQALFRGVSDEKAFESHLLAGLLKVCLTCFRENPTILYGKLALFVDSVALAPRFRLKPNFGRPSAYLWPQRQEPDSSLAYRTRKGDRNMRSVLRIIKPGRNKPSKDLQAL